MNVEFTELRRLPDRELLHRVVGDGALGITSLAKAFGLQLGDDTGYSSGSGHQLLLCARELMSRALAESIQCRPTLGQPRAVQDFLRLKIGGLPYESFWVLFMDSQVRLISAEELFRGTLTQTSVYPREIVKRALHFNAGSVILAHNHPSGISQPSRADEALTNAIKASLALVDVRVLDHIIVGEGETASMAAMGLM